ncbi:MULTISPECIES: transmembrane transport protein [Catenuloplanes]|uniref:ABC-type transport system involved in multi-copper enzyme maturation permease subunit n=1 Tax=Catenuloplanes niger TaxID=587534 RepID=A0AAE3ZTZ9_9ACTN|nr:transmembrane transport protein [Catenuloplanes niger]MDR7326043.1 ABC-type transport system involved in multi-copper enzyme maturation permease subunit [Catenuloplanes niger]
MIWLTWRQARARILFSSAALAVVAIALVALGLALRGTIATRHGGCLSCVGTTTRLLLENRFGAPLLIAGVALLAVPVLIGVFWGAPLVARELAAGTHRLAWSQSVTRGRWLAVKLGLLGLLTLVLTGVFSALLTWVAHPWDAVFGDRFGAIEFASRGVAPLGHALFAFVLGGTAGLLLRRTVPAMVVTLVIFAAVQIAVPLAVRPYLRSPVTETVVLDAAARQNHTSFDLPRNDEVWLVGYARPGRWMVRDTAPLLHPDGSAPAPATVDACFRMAWDPACVDAAGLVFTVTYHPYERYWSIQWLELAAYTALAALTAGVAFWRLRRVS